MEAIGALAYLIGLLFFVAGLGVAVYGRVVRSLDYWALGIVLMLVPLGVYALAHLLLTGRLP